jgi:hypothetical protein
MNLVYREEVGQNSSQASAWLTLDSDAGEPDLHFAGQQGLAPVSLPGFDGVQQQVLAKETPVLDFPDVVASRVSLVAATEAGEHARQLIELAIPPDVRLLAFSFPAASGLASATVDGQLAYDSSLANRHSPNGRSLAINHPRPGKAKLEFEFTGETPAEVLMTARFDLPEELLQSYSADWPLDAQPAFLGSRALKTWRLKLAVESPAGG